VYSNSLSKHMYVEVGIAEGAWEGRYLMREGGVESAVFSDIERDYLSIFSQRSLRNGQRVNLQTGLESLLVPKSVWQLITCLNPVGRPFDHSEVAPAKPLDQTGNWNWLKVYFLGLGWITDVAAGRARSADPTKWPLVALPCRTCLLCLF
jgi:hypothetical protein